MPKIGTNWNKIEPGDIISFKYKSAVDPTKPQRTSTILVLNVKYPKKLKSGKVEYYLNGFKLEASNISVFSNRNDAWNLLAEMGWVSIRSLRNELYKIEIPDRYVGTYGVTGSLFKKIMNTPAGKKAEFRTYNWEQVRKGTPYYEPVKLPKDKILLLETQRAANEN